MKFKISASQKRQVSLSSSLMDIHMLQIIWYFTNTQYASFYRESRSYGFNATLTSHT